MPASAAGHRAGRPYRGVSGGRAHPAIAIERDSRLAFARLIRELALDAEPPHAWRAGPPALHSNRRMPRGGIGITLDD